MRHQRTKATSLKSANDKTADIDPITLELLGEVPSKDAPLGPDIHVALAERWKKVLSEGLNEDIRKELIAKYPLPANCTTVKAPTLNAEIKPASNVTALRRDHDS
uniref:Uncharacterized protein n=1 Tax=Bracon brevicornis TaxID=1563983 RepID=A0A6V7LMT9_9HYME